mgnify:CR=1 FL=1
MTINNLLNVKSRDELREWLMHNYENASAKLRFANAYESNLILFLTIDWANRYRAMLLAIAINAEHLAIVIPIAPTKHVIYFLFNVQTVPKNMQNVAQIYVKR